MILHRKKQNTFDKKRRFGTASRRFFIHFAYVRVKFVSRSFCRRRPPRTENFARGNNISSRPTFSRVFTRFCFALFRFAMTETSLGRTSFHVTGPLEGIRRWRNAVRTFFSVYFPSGAARPFPSIHDDAAAPSAIPNTQTGRRKYTTLNGFGPEVIVAAHFVNIRIVTKPFCRRARAFGRVRLRTLSTPVRRNIQYIVS